MGRHRVRTTGCIDVESRRPLSAQRQGKESGPVRRNRPSGVRWRRARNSRRARVMPWWKRAVDVTVASVGLVALSPVFAAADDPHQTDVSGPGLFPPGTGGLPGTKFYLWNSGPCTPTWTAPATGNCGRCWCPWRKPAKGRPSDGETEPRSPCDPVWRIPSPFLPGRTAQLFNVLRGEMSLVGRARRFPTRPSATRTGTGAVLPRCRG